MKRCGYKALIRCAYKVLRSSIRRSYILLTCAYKVLYSKNRENKVLRSKMGGIIVTPLYLNYRLFYNENRKNFLHLNYRSFCNENRKNFGFENFGCTKNLSLKLATFNCICDDTVFVGFTNFVHFILGKL